MPPHRPHDPREGERAHDVLAAEEFALPSVDPALHVEDPHDVLAAEEFAMPSVDPYLHHHGPVSLPGDPTGIAGPHDVLAAEEFALPAGRSGASLPVAGEARGRGPRLMALGALALLVLRRPWRT